MESACCSVVSGVSARRATSVSSTWTAVNHGMGRSMAVKSVRIFLCQETVRYAVYVDNKCSGNERA